MDFLMVLLGLMITVITTRLFCFGKSKPQKLLSDSETKKTAPDKKDDYYDVSKKIRRQVNHIKTPKKKA